MTPIRFKAAAAIFTAAACLILLLSPAASADGPAMNASYATFEGRSIDLSKGWGDAHSCVVFSIDRTECFRTHAEANAAATGKPMSPVSAATVNADWDCTHGWLCLFRDDQGRGDRLIFSSEYWHDLTTWNFHGQTSSIRNNQACGAPWFDSASLGDGFGGVFNISDCSRYGNLGPWNDVAIHVHG